MSNFIYELREEAKDYDAEDDYLPAVAAFLRQAAEALDTALTRYQGEVDLEATISKMETVRIEQPQSQLTAAQERVAELEGALGWRDIEAVLASMGPRMRETRRALTSESRLDHVGIRQAARAIGISPTTYQRVEAGHIPDFRTAKKIMLWIEGQRATLKEGDDAE